ncbi:hypothetical protein [Sulfitobacter sp.]|uniref:hypothetical protein n=1 Tax=Sulfitobacter sp. TaxID=1903071 RepID=UPI0030020B86
MSKAIAWPVWRTDVEAAAALSTRDWLYAVLGAVLIPPCAALIPVLLIDSAQVAQSNVAAAIYYISFLVLPGPVVTWFVALVGGLLLEGAIRLGLGGWGVAVSLGVVLGSATIVLFQATFSSAFYVGFWTFFVLHGAMTAALCWLILRIRAPEVFKYHH